MTACTISMLDEWKNHAVAAEDQSQRIEMNREFKELTADIIAHTAFGSSFVQGREAFKAQEELQKYCAASNADFFIPGSQYLPTPTNLQIWKLDRKMKNSLKCIIESRLNSKATGSPCHNDDLLGLMIEASEIGIRDNSPTLNVNDIMEECKTFFFAGHETTSNLLTWAAFLLSLHSEWQEKLRQEVLKECGMGIPDADMLAKLKLMNMFLLEALRLYGPVVELFREASKDMKLGDVMIPKGTCISIPIVKIHRRKDYWGEDANEFNPLRFINGISKAAKHPNALLAFAVGPRACIGQNFAMLEAKTVIALILQRFSLSLSPEYKHAPTDNLTIQPQHGLPIIVKPLRL
uniref:Cytochrome P450 n=1 Tax=Fagus sylvatica TaxID=28930 RepID=A0A2N9G880_FAGSY